jgi:hypothetical protein
MNKSNTQSALERACTPLSPRKLLARLTGCAQFSVGVYDDVLREVEAQLVWAGPRRVSLTAATYADPQARRAKLTEYIWTEFFGGVFIDEFMARHPYDEEKLLRRHSNDEVRHGEAFARYAGAHPPTLNREPPAEAEGARDTYRAYLDWTGGDFTAFIAILHVLELRTAVILTQWFHLLEMFPESDYGKIQPMLARIARDEVFHLSYTLQILSGKLGAAGVRETLREAFLLSEATIPQILDASERRNTAGSAA